MAATRTIGLAAGILALLLVAAPARAEEFDLEGMKELLAEGTTEFNHAGDTRLDRPTRNKHLKAAYDLLNRTLKMLDEWCEAHPEDVEALDDYFGQIARMRYFVRKEAPNGVLNDGPEPPRVPRPDWPPKPPDDLHDPALPPGQRPPAPAPGDPDPGGDKPKSYDDVVRQHVEFANEYERKHPNDIVGLRDIYLDILEHAPEGSSAYLAAMKRFSELNGKLKAVYREIRDRDFDELERSGTEERKLVHKLADDLDDRDADIRLRAAEYLGRLGSGEGARHLVKQLYREKEERVREQIQGSLTDIGGAKVARELAKAKGKRKEEAMRVALEVLTSLAASSPVEARHASEALGAYTLSGFAPIASEALRILEEIGPVGVWGLMEATKLKDHYIRLRVLKALGETGEGVAGDMLGGFLVYGAKGKLVEQRNVALESLRKIGKPCVPYVARFLGNPRLRQFTKFVLREITGQSFKTEGQALSWWKRNGG